MELSTDNLKIVGDVELIVASSDGTIKEKREIKNLVVSGGKAWIANRMLYSTASVMTHIAVGTSNVVAAAGNTGLSSELARVALTSSTLTSNQITYNAFIPSGTGTGVLQEAGIFNAATAGTMLCRTVFSAVNKDVADTLTINWTITIL